MFTTQRMQLLPLWVHRIVLAGQSHFGDLVVFDDPITLDYNLHSPQVGRAQGFYMYDKKDVFKLLGLVFPWCSIPPCTRVP